MEKKTKVARWTKKDDDVSEGDKVMIGGRLVTEEEYKAARTFVFLHHFAGGKDGLKVALEKEAAKRNMKVKVFSIEKKNGSDLLATQPYQSNLKDLKEGNVDGYHSGFPCATYSRLRWNDREGYPGPLRSKTEPYGFRSLSVKEKKEADDGTIMMVRSIEACRALEVNEAEFRIHDGKSTTFKCWEWAAYLSVGNARDGRLHGECTEFSKSSLPHVQIPVRRGPRHEVQEAANVWW